MSEKLSEQLVESHTRALAMGERVVAAAAASEDASQRAKANGEAYTHEVADRGYSEHSDYLQQREEASWLNSIDRKTELKTAEAEELVVRAEGKQLYDENAEAVQQMALDEAQAAGVEIRRDTEA